MDSRELCLFQVFEGFLNNPFCDASGGMQMILLKSFAEQLRGILLAAHMQPNIPCSAEKSDLTMPLSSIYPDRLFVRTKYHRPLS